MAGDLVLDGCAGKYEFHTEFPGMYGILNGASPLFDLPPFLPQHIHVVAYHPDHEVFMTQFYWDQDPARAHDIRAKIGGVSLGSEEPELQMHIQPCVVDGEETNCATVDMVLKALPEGQQHASREQALTAAMCASKTPADPIAVCHPELLPYARLRYVLPVLAVVLLLVVALVVTVLRLVLKLVFGGRRSAKSAAAVGAAGAAAVSKKDKKKKVQKAD